MTFTHHDYTVAWICALPLEMAAAKVMLDEIHPDLFQPSTDHNTYTLGRFGGHNVAIACLPSGVYGTTSAATVLSHMLPTFPSLRFGLMVGIGGGVPSNSTDVRLGDIIVSMPNITSGGVIQYDYGKTLRDGRFQRTGSLNKPPQFLLTAVSQMRSNYMLGERPIEGIISTTLQKHQEMRDQFSRPDKDWLFNSMYDHQNNDTDCSKCDQTQLVNRVPRETEEPYIHYGLIASGNQVMKDAKTRDSIAQEIDILCFEMEAAGLMDLLPCLVIRGVCDYCDSHKHKQWQGYAALVAAAYARTLLTIVPIHDKSAGLKIQIDKEHHWMVPFRRNSRFVGREEQIAEIEGLITQPSGAFKLAICGLGGVGKTQIALELAYRMRDECSIFWIPCTSYESVEQAYMSMAQIVGIPGVKPAEAKGRVKAYFSQKGAGKWLLIFDNADDMDMWIKGNTNTPPLMDFLPDGEQGHILFTTRNRKLAVRMVSYVIPIVEPDEGTSVKILEQSLINKTLVTDANESLTFLRQLAFLPLAITQAAAYINKNDIGLSEYTTLLQEQEPDVIELLSQDFGDDGRYKDIQNPITTTWLISFQQIQKLNQLAADYLSFMACINPRHIPQSLLPQATSNHKRVEAIGLLKAFSFISEQGKDKSLNLHRLVHLAMRNWMQNNQQFDLQILKTADRLCEVFPSDDHSNQKLWREYLPHALPLIREVKVSQGQRKYTDLACDIAYCLFEDGRYYEAEELQVQAIETRKRILGPEHPSTLVSMGNLASIYRKQGQWKEAEELGLEVIEIRKRILGSKHPNTLISMSNLASIYRNQGRWKEAEELGLQVMEISKRILGSEHPDTLISMGNLASIYSHQGRWKEAEELGLEVIEIRKRILGSKHPNTLISMSNLALIYKNQGRWKEAEELGLEVIEISKRILGSEHPDTLISMGNLASIYSDQERWKEAEELELQVMEISKRVLGPEHPNTLVSMSNLASTYNGQGRWKEAEELGLQVMEISKRILGSEHPNTLISMNNLAYSWKFMGKVQDALGLMEQCVELQNKVLRPDHPNAIKSSRTLKRWKAAENSSAKTSYSLDEETSGKETKDQSPQRVSEETSITLNAYDHAVKQSTDTRPITHGKWQALKNFFPET